MGDELLGIKKIQPRRDHSPDLSSRYGALQTLTSMIPAFTSMCVCVSKSHERIPEGNHRLNSYFQARGN